MSLLRKPQFEQLRHTTFESKKALREADVAAIQSDLVDFLNAAGDVLIERARRPNRVDPLIEINGMWMGPASSHKEIIDLLKGSWPWPPLQQLEASAIIEEIDELVVARVVATTEDRYLTVKIQIRV